MAGAARCSSPGASTSTTACSNARWNSVGPAGSGHGHPLTAATRAFLVSDCDPPLEVKPGYYMHTNASNHSYRCATKAACLGGVLSFGDASCEVGYTGLICGGQTRIERAALGNRTEG